MINLVAFNNFNISQKNTVSNNGVCLNFSANSLKSLEKDTVSFSTNKNQLNKKAVSFTGNKYQLKRENFYGGYCQDFPLENDNSYRIIYYNDLSEDVNEKGEALYPPSHIVFKKPVDMQIGLDVCKQHLLGFDEWALFSEKQIDILKDFLPTCEELKNEKLVSCMDAMNNTIVLELEGNRVLKMIKYNPFPEGRPYEPEFDLPVLSNVYNVGDYYVFVQEKAYTDDIDREALDDVIERIELAGYEPYDIRGNEMQVGWSEIMQDYMLLDTECAQVKK